MASEAFSKQPDPVGDGDRRPLSQMALAGLVVGIGGVAIPCCPLMPVAAVLLGFLAHRKIRAGTVRGARLALAAMLLGGAGLLVQGLAIDWFSNRYRAEVESRSEARIDAVLRAAQSNEVEAIAEAWGSRGSLGDLRSLGAATLDRYGAFKGASVVKWTYGSGLSQPDLTAAVVWEFERRSLTGSFRMELIPGTSLGDPFPSPRPAEIVISDDRGGDLRIGGEPSEDGPPGGDPADGST